MKFIASFTFVMVAMGCMRPSPPIVLHTLRALEQPPEPGHDTRLKPAQGKEQATPIAVEVLPVRIPEVLQRPQLVIVQGPDRMGLSETHRWGNSLERDIQRVVVQNLSVLLGSPSIVAHPEGSRVKATLRLDLDIQRLEGQPGGQLLLEAHWTLLDAQSRVLIRRPVRLMERVESSPNGELDSLANAHSRIIQTLCRDMAQEIRNF